MLTCTRAAVKKILGLGSITLINYRGRGDRGRGRRVEAENHIAAAVEPADRLLRYRDDRDRICGLLQLPHMVSASWANTGAQV